MKFDLNTAAVAERDFTSGSYEVIPDETQVTVLIDIVRSYNTPRYDEDSNGLLTLSKNGDSAFLSLEFTIMGGDFDKRKFWERWYLRGDSETAMNISMTKIRAIVEAVRGISPTDQSPPAQKKRQIELKDLDKMEFEAALGIERGRGKDQYGEPYPDKNVIKRVINGATPDKPSATVTKPAAPKKNGGASAKPAAVEADW